jgi:hypothetical protein
MDWMFKEIKKRHTYSHLGVDEVLEKPVRMHAMPGTIQLFIKGRNTSSMHPILPHV